MTCRSSTTRPGTSTSRSCTTARDRRKDDEPAVHPRPARGNKGAWFARHRDDRTLFFDFLPLWPGDLGFTDALPALHRARPDVLRRDPQARAAGRGRRGVRGRLPVGPLRDERRELPQPRRNLRSTASTWRRSPSCCSSTSATSIGSLRSTTWSFSSTAATGASPTFEAVAVGGHRGLRHPQHGVAPGPRKESVKYRR